MGSLSNNSMAPRASTKRPLLPSTRGFIFYRFVLFFEGGSGWSKGFGPNVIRVWRQKQQYDGPFNSSSVPPRRDPLPPLDGGTFNPADGVGAVETCWHYRRDRQLGSPLARRNPAYSPGVEGRL